jgi:hypothetical protein
MTLNPKVARHLILMVAALCVQVAEPNRLRHPVPGFKYILVDEASLHRDRPPEPARPLHLRPQDTSVDIKIDGRIYSKEDFWCVPRNQVQFNSGRTSCVLEAWPPNPYPRERKITNAAMEAVEHLVCVDLELGR